LPVLEEGGGMVCDDVPGWGCCVDDGVGVSVNVAFLASETIFVSD
jgi:hypothetical protein